MNARASLAQSLPPVYAAAAVRVAFPLLVLPVMAARLGVEEFGRLGLCLVWAGLLSLVVEGGFMAAAMRHAVAASVEERGRLAKRIFSARCVLSVPVLLAALAVGAWVVPSALPLAQRWETALLLALLSCALGWPATWYLQATSQLHRWALVEFAVHGLLLAACLLWAQSLLMYLLMQCVAQWTLALVGWYWLTRDLGADFRSDLWSRREVRPGLELGGTMLPVSLLGTAYTLGLPAVAATQLGQAELGVYFLADRLVRALVSATEPLMQLVFPRIVERFRISPRWALAYASRWAAAGLVLGLAVGLGAYLAWPIFQSSIGGDVGAARLREVLAVSGWLIPLAMSWRFLGYWMLGSGRYDRAYRACVVAGAVVGIAGAWGWGHSAVALAAVAVAAELAVIAAAGAGVLITEWHRRR